MNYRRLNHRGLVLPYVIGLVTFFIAITVTLMLYATSQTRLIQTDIESSEAYYQAKEKVKATVQIIIRDGDTSPEYLSDLATYMGVSISSINANVWQVSAGYDTTSSLSSFIAMDVETIDVVNEQLVYTGFEDDYVPNDYFTAFNLHNAYLPIDLADHYPELTPPTFTDINSMFSYIKSLPDSIYDEVTTRSITNMSNPTISDDVYVGGSISNMRKNLTVVDGYFPFIDGSLSMRAGYSLYGNMVIDGNLTLNDECDFVGTIYVDGNVTLSGDVHLGTSSRPAFIIATGSITVGNSIDVYGYLIGSTTNVGWFDDLYFEGGIYPSISGFTFWNYVTPNTSIVSEDLYAYALPISVVESTAPGETTFVYTSPK